MSSGRTARRGDTRIDRRQSVSRSRRSEDCIGRWEQSLSFRLRVSSDLHRFYNSHPHVDLRDMTDRESMSTKCPC